MGEPDLARRFHRALLDAYETARDEYNYLGTYALHMVNEMEAVPAAKQLINSPAPAEGFTRLWELGGLGLTVEAIALRPEFRRLFEPEELERARNRLREYDYPIP